MNLKKNLLTRLTVKFLVNFILYTYYKVIMVVRVINFFYENLMRLLCIRKFQKKEKLRKSGYIVDFPNDFYTYPYGYSVIRRSIWNPTVYTRYGKTYTIDDIKNMYNIN